MIATTASGGDVPFDENSYLLAVGALAVMRRLQEAEIDKGKSGRADKMRRVATDLAERLEAINGVALAAKTSSELLDILPDSEDPRWSDEERVVFLIETATWTPFAPHYLKYSKAALRVFLSQVGERIGVEAERVAWIEKWLKDVRSHHKHGDVRRTLLLGVASAAILAGTAGAAAPVIAPMFGAAGLSGIAALLSGLAVLGGGTVATGGLGVAGGMWVLTGGGALLGGGAGVGVAALLAKFESSTAIAEIVKAQVTFKVVYVDELAHDAAGSVGGAIDSVVKQRTEAMAEKTHLLARNEKDGPEVKNVEEIIKALDDAIKWMTDRVEHAPGEQFVV
jgi:hypothetical protein